MPDKTPAEALSLLADLGEHLARAQKILQGPPRPDGKSTPGEDAELPRVFAVAQEAVAGFAAVVDGLYRPAEGAPRLALRHTGSGVTVLADAALTGEPGRQEVAAFIEEIRAADARLLRLAELLGLLLGLAARWTAAGFAPPVVLASLRPVAAQVLALGAALKSESAV